MGLPSSFSVQSRFSSGQITGLPGSVPGSLSQNGFFQYYLGNSRILLQENHQLLGHYIIHSASGLTVSKLLLSLALKLRLRNLDTDDSSEPFTNVLTA